jgi:pyridoxamine 5'-phosphate oxidase
LLRQIRITGSISSVSDEEADNYYKSRSYDSRIGAWASQQSQILNSREELLSEIENFKKKYPNEKNVPRPKHWSGWRLSPVEIEFWLGGRSRIHERLKYIKKQNKNWEKVLLYP